jgi:hypothetical protein
LEKHIPARKNPGKSDSNDVCQVVALDYRG